MLLSPLPELTLAAVLEPGVPNQECIAIRSEGTVNLGLYGLMLGLYQGPQHAIPLKDNMLWFGEAWIRKGDWVFVYTGEGQATSSIANDGVSVLYSIYWGRKHTLLMPKKIVPILFRMDAANVDEIDLSPSVESAPFDAYGAMTNPVA